ncbi:MAG: glycosyltransferase [Crenarchaeota archaeon]|nr:MAG: glycosyltransferase [Thermoproteota archaeon]RDJ33360.1 MAG: glycosyltransferase [Thermoproteota archaeon]RDJ36136.1 MAG: glycosyltransferase [Thermoproteota archaeon]RDJ38768.1 MAG: glycosyltransferase [Thermoproteota archaeon]
MKILYIAPTYKGGIGGHAKRVAEKLRENDIEVDLMDVPHIPIKKLKNPSFTLFGTLKAKFAKEKYDIVHAWNIPSAFVMKQVNARKKVLSVHGVYSEQVSMIHSSPTGTLAKIGEKKALALADVLTTDSKTVQHSYREKLKINFEYLPAPLDTKKFDDIPKASQKLNQIIYIGRDSYEKGIDILKEIEPKINADVVYCTNVSWNEAMTQLCKSRMLVIPSRIESIPQVIKEAFFLKIPVVSTEVGGVPEIIENSKTGILVPPNSPTKLLEAINDLLKNQDKANFFSDHAYEYIIKNFTWDVLLDKYLNFYKNLLKN